jgi:hypothetical protein
MADMVTLKNDDVDDGKEGGGEVVVEGEDDWLKDPERILYETVLQRQATPEDNGCHGLAITVRRRAAVGYWSFWGASFLDAVPALVYDALRFTLILLSCPRCRAFQ